MRRKSLEAAPASSGVLKAFLGDEGSGHLQRAEGTPEAWTSLPMGPAGFGADREVPTLVVDDQQLVLLPNLPQRFSPNRAVIWSSSELLLPVNSKHSTPSPMSRTAADRCTRPWPIGQSVQRAPSARCSRAAWPRRSHRSCRLPRARDSRHTTASVPTPAVVAGKLP